MWSTIFYIIGAIVFARLSDYALNGENATGMAPAMYMVGAVIWPLVLLVSAGRFTYSISAHFIDWLFNSRV